MKQVKFRVWNGHEMENKVMAGFLGAFYVQGIDENDSASMSPFNTKYHDNTPVMQFIGLADKNNIEIFEDDIINIEAIGNITKVYFDQNTALFRMDSFVEFEDGTPLTYGFDEIQKDGIEIIGNIHANPELL